MSGLGAFAPPMMSSHDQFLERGETAHFGCPSSNGVTPKKADEDEAFSLIPRCVKDRSESNNSSLLGDTNPNSDILDRLDGGMRKSREAMAKLERHLQESQISDNEVSCDFIDVVSCTREVAKTVSVSFRSNKTESPGPVRSRALPSRRPRPPKIRLRHRQSRLVMPDFSAASPRSCSGSDSVGQCAVVASLKSVISQLYATKYSEKRDFAATLLIGAMHHLDSTSEHSQESGVSEGLQQKQQGKTVEPQASAGLKPQGVQRIGITQNKLLSGKITYHRDRGNNADQGGAPLQQSGPSSH